MGLINIRVRGVDKAEYLKFKAFAKKEGLKIGEALTLAMKHYIKTHRTSANYLNHAYLK